MGGTLREAIEKAFANAVVQEWGDKQGTQWTLIDWNRISNVLKMWGPWLAKGNHLYRFNGLYYGEITAEEIRAELKHRSELYNLEDKNKYSTKKADEVITQLSDAIQFHGELDMDHVIPFQNGFWTEEKFLPIDKYFMFDQFHITRVLPLDYTPASCPHFERLMRILLPNPTDREEVLTFLAYTLMPVANNLRYHQVWWGGGNNGKSQLAEHWGVLMGDLCAFVPLNNLLNDKHAMVGIRGKNLNISSEIKGVMLNPISIDRAKSMTTDRWLTGRDIYESQRKAQYPNICRFLLTANDLPYSEYMAEDKAFFSRWKLIHWEYIWNPADWQDYLDEQGTTKHVFDKIFAMEGGAIVAYVMSFIPQIQRLTIDWEETQEAWVSAGNSTIAFLNNPGIDDEHDTQKRKLYEQYIEWCKRTQRKANKYQTFFKTLKGRGYQEIRKYASDGDGGQVSEQYIEALSYNQKKEAMALVGRQTELDVMIEGGK